MRVLVTTQPGSGHWRPLAPFAHALGKAGHDVAFATTPAFCAIIAGFGFRTFAAGSEEADSAPDLHDEHAVPPVEPPQAPEVWANLFAGSRAVRSVPDLLAICYQWRPDLIMREISEFGGCLVAERLGLPHAAVQVSAYRPHLHQSIAAPLNRLRASLCLPPDPDLDMLYRYLLLTPVPTSFHDPDLPLPATAQAVCSVPFDRQGENGLPTWVASLPPRPTVYATLGTAYNRIPGIFPAILAGLHGEPLNLILAIGDQDPADLGSQPPHVHVARYIPQSLIFPRCDLVITHGGFGTVTTALDHGLPMVVIPIAADQPDNARRCAALGLARVIPSTRRTPEAIRTATRTVLRDPTYRRHAERLRDELHALPDLARAVGMLERLVVEKRPMVAVG